MTGEINRVPVGLLSLLDMKARGQAPRILSGEVQAGIDLSTLYLQGSRELRRGTATAVLGGVTVAVQTVPQLEYWAIWGIHLQSITIAAGTTIRLAPGILRVDNNSNNNNLLVLGQPQQFTAGEAIGIGVTFETPYIARPNDVVGFHVSNLVTGTAPSVVCNVDLSRISF